MDVCFSICICITLSVLVPASVASVYERVRVFSVIDCSLLQTVLDISSCLADNASYSMAGEALTHAVTTVQQVWLYVGMEIPKL